MSSSSKPYQQPPLHEMRRLNEDPVLTLEQGAVYLNVRPSLLRDMHKQRRISTIKVGDLVRIRLSECERILREGARPATKPILSDRFA